MNDFILVVAALSSVTSLTMAPLVARIICVDAHKNLTWIALFMSDTLHSMWYAPSLNALLVRSRYSVHFRRFRQIVRIFQHYRSIHIHLLLYLSICNTASQSARIVCSNTCIRRIPYKNCEAEVLTHYSACQSTATIRPATWTLSTKMYKSRLPHRQFIHMLL